MWNALVSLFEKIACKHQWEEHAKLDYVALGYNNPAATNYLFIGNECGKFKKVESRC